MDHHARQSGGANGGKMDYYVTTKHLQDQFHGRFCSQEHAHRMRCEIFCHFGAEMLNLSVTVCTYIHVAGNSHGIRFLRTSLKMVSVHKIFLVMDMNDTAKQEERNGQ